MAKSLNYDNQFNAVAPVVDWNNPESTPNDVSLALQTLQVSNNPTLSTVAVLNSAPKELLTRAAGANPVIINSVSNSAYRQARTYASMADFNRSRSNCTSLGTNISIVYRFHSCPIAVPTNPLSHVKCISNDAVLINLKKLKHINKFSFNTIVNFICSSPPQVDPDHQCPPENITSAKINFCNFCACNNLHQQILLDVRGFFVHNKYTITFNEHIQRQVTAGLIL